MVAVLVMAPLAACTLYDSVFARTRPPPCPQVSVLPDGSRLTRFGGGPGRDIIDVLFSGEIADVLMACSYDLDKETGEGKVTVEIALVVGAERGPADHDRKAAFTYFVAVADTDNNVLNKQTFDLEVAFTGNQTRVSTVDQSVGLDIPLKEGKTGQDFNVVVGFQLTREELEFNRRNASTR